MENNKKKNEGKSERHIIHSLQTFTERDNEDIHEDIFVNINNSSIILDCVYDIVCDKANFD